MKFFIVFLFSSFLASQAWASNIYVAPVQGSNISNEKLETLRELIKIQVQDYPQHRLVNTLDKAEFFVQTKLIKFDTYTLSMSRWKGNSKVSTGQWNSPDLASLEPMVQKAVAQILENGEENQQKAILFDNKKSLGEQAEEKKKRSNFERVEAKKQVVIGFGPTYFSNMNSPGTAIGFLAGFVWNIDDHFDLGLQSDFAISTDHSDAHIFNGKIVANYFFASRDISPFIGAGFGYGWASAHDGNNSIKDDTAGGFGMSLQAGVKFFRTSTVNFGVSGEYSTIFNENSLGNPSAFLVRVALYY